MVDRTLYRQQKTATLTHDDKERRGKDLFFPGLRVLVLPSLLLSIWCSVHHYFPLLSWSSCVSVAVFCCLYSVLSTIISPSFPGHRVLVLLSLLLSIWCSVHHYFPLLSVDRTIYTQQKTEQHQNTLTRKEGGNNGGQNTIYTTKN
jgi:hypothetical protein